MIERRFTKGIARLTKPTLDSSLRRPPLRIVAVGVQRGGIGTRTTSQRTFRFIRLWKGPGVGQLVSMAAGM